MKFIYRGPADKYRGGPPSKSDRLRREEIHRHKQALEGMPYSDEEGPSSNQVRHYKRPKEPVFEAPKKKRRSWWRFFIG